MKIKLGSLILIFSLVLIGCQNKNLNLGKSVTEIKVVTWGETEEFVTSIKDEEFIRELIDKLNKAKTVTTANADMEMPDFKLYFKHNKEVIYEIGYFKRVMGHNGILGQYWDTKKIYDVILELPIE
ncbi:hypothetical protein [Neobacillus piezotolerans]|uniref:hypothetical protein n=1 Tax=Neobacillus piezotolerans TaxID=2259171 RepID=UPI00115BC6E4|nr:hypothetical protein [Neobacillus piezotolerans]